MEHSFIYIGCFFQREEFYSAVAGIRKNKLEREIADPHVTFKYKPDKVDTALFGVPVKAVVTGYANDGKNEGVSVRLSCAVPEIQEMTESIAVPHITIALSGSGEPVDTKKLNFLPVPPVEITGLFGGYSVLDGTVTESVTV